MSMPSVPMQQVGAMQSVQYSYGQQPYAAHPQSYNQPSAAQQQNQYYPPQQGYVPYQQYQGQQMQQGGYGGQYQPNPQMYGPQGGYQQPYQGGFAGPAVYQGVDGYGRGYGRGGFGRGGFQGGFGRGGGPGALRRKKPFVGGTLDSQRAWERNNLCCFYLQGQCKFGDRCRFSHEDDGVRRCHFNLACRVGHQNRGGASDAPQAPAPSQQQQQQQPAAQQVAAQQQPAAPPQQQPQPTEGSAAQN